MSPMVRSRGEGWLAAVHDDDANRFRQAWRDAAASKTQFSAEARLRRDADGMYRWHVARAVPERDAQGAIVGWLGTYSDFEDLKQAVQARDDFLIVASHELRTPLTTLQLKLEGLRKRSNDAATACSCARSCGTELDVTLRQTHRLAKLVHDLLDVARVSAGHLLLETEPLDACAVVREVVERMTEEATRVGCTLELHTPQEANAGRVRWDRMRIEQVVTNLLSNALKYAAGKPIQVGIYADAAAVTLNVTDHGIGIPAEDVQRIFGRFERAVTTRNYGGLGIGLYVARQIAEAHGGTIRATSEVGVGSTFIVVLPREPP